MSANSQGVRSTFPPETVDEIAVRMELVNACAEAGGREKFAGLHGYTPTLIDDFIQGKRTLPMTLVGCLGYRAVVRYVKRSPARSEAA